MRALIVVSPLRALYGQPGTGIRLYPTDYLGIQLKGNGQVNDLLGNGLG